MLLDFQYWGQHLISLPRCTIVEEQQRYGKLKYLLYPLYWQTFFMPLLKSVSFKHLSWNILMEIWVSTILILVALVNFHVYCIYLFNLSIYVTPVHLSCLFSELRLDTLSQILTMSNVRAHCRMMVVESCQGMVVGALLERMGGQ